MNIFENLPTHDFFMFFILFLPGFFSLKAYEHIVATEKNDFSKKFLDAVSYGFFNFAVLFFWMKPLNDYADLSIVSIILFVFYMFVCPIAWPFLYKKLLTSKWISKKVLSPHATPWDYVFDKREPYWVIVNLKNGKRIGGMFSKNSEASSYPHKGQIYLEKTCVLDDNGVFQSVNKNSNGVIILEDEISNIEFLEA